MLPHHEDTLRRVIVTMLPPEGGREIAMIEKSIRQQLDARSQDGTLMADLFEQMRARSEAEFAQPVNELSAPRFEALLQRLSDETEPVVHFAYHLLRQWVLGAFYLSDTGRDVLGYHPPIEGGYPDYGAALEIDCQTV